MIRLVSILMIVVAAGLLGSTATAQDAARMQVAAARGDALNALRSDVRAARITPTLTVAQFLDRTGPDDALDDIVQQSQQIGDPRWLDEQTCQVRLELSGLRVARSLVAIAATRPRLTPIPAGAMEQVLGDWRNRTFVATGTSVSASKIPGIRPLSSGQEWAGISDDARRAALAAARQDAAQHVLDDIKPISLSNGQTVGDLLAREPVQAAVRNWVAAQPVTNVKFDDDLHVELTVGVPPDALMQTVVTSARDVPGTTLPADEQSLDALEREFARRVSAATGRAVVPQGVPAATRQVSRTIDLPAQLPFWVGTLIDAEGSSSFNTNPLRTKNAAVNKATENLRSRINSLTLDRNLTLEDAAKQDPRIAEAINRTLLRARVYKVEYLADQSISVRMTIDSRDLWGELLQATRQ
jgi:hypothetical protein